MEEKFKELISQLEEEHDYTISEDKNSIIYNLGTELDLVLTKEGTWFLTETEY